MMIARAVVEYFDKSTQATNELKKVQKNGMIERYQNQPEALKPLQDVVTRWWSTFHMLKHLRFLKPAILLLQAAEKNDGLAYTSSVENFTSN